MPRYHGSGWDSPKLLALLRLSPDLSGCVRTAAGTHPASLMKNAPARPPRGGKRNSSPWASLSCTRSCRACSSDSRLAKPRSSPAGLPSLSVPDHPLAALCALPCEKAGLCHFAFAFSPISTSRMYPQPEGVRKQISPGCLGRGSVASNTAPRAGRESLKLDS
jgi:hypothetical protein